MRLGAVECHGAEGVVVHLLLFLLTRDGARDARFQAISQSHVVSKKKKHLSRGE